MTRVVANADVRSDHTEMTDANVVAEPGTRVNNGGLSDDSAHAFSVLLVNAFHMVTGNHAG